MKQEIEQLQNNLNKLKAKYEESLKPKFEVGKWLTFIGINYKQNGLPIVNYQGEDKGYGIDNSGNWCQLENDKKWTFETNPNDWRYSTDQEILEALEKESNELYKDASGIININDTGYVMFSQDGSFIYNILRNRGYYKGALVFDSGQWAKPIPKELTLEDHAKQFNNMTCNSRDTSINDFINYFAFRNLKIVKDETNS